MSASYFFPVLKLTETLGGLVLLTGRFTPIALIVLAPVTVQIFLFHLFLTPMSQVAMPLIMVLLHAFLGWAYFPAFAGLFKANSKVRA